MANVAAKDMWGAVLMRGIAAVLFGIAAVFWPGITLVTLVYLFSAFILVSGIMTMVAALVTADETMTGRLLMVLVSVLEIGVGVYLLRHPGVSFATLVLLIGFSLVVHGVFDVVSGLFGSGRTATYKMLNVVGGVLAALAGIVVLFQPAASGVAFVWILGLWALISGPMLIAMSLDIKNS